MENIDNYILDFLKYTAGVSEDILSWVYPLTAAFAVALFSLLCTALFRFVIMPMVQRVTEKTKAKWDDYLFHPRVMRAFRRIIPPVIWYVTLPYVFAEHSGLLSFSLKACNIYLVVVSLLFVSEFLHSLYEISAEHQKLRNRPLKGIYQMFNLLAFVVGCILIVSIVIDKSATAVLAGLGASAAVLMLIFKDSILGLVAGVQLSANDMLRPGDWITVSKHGINGTVEDITLNTVKIRNFDHTILTIPPYLLVNEPFQNWRYMKESGSRRMVQTLCIDIRSVRLLSLEEVAALPAYPLVKDLPELQPGGESLRSFPNRIVNLTLFRHYVQHYLAHHPIARTEDRFFVVRELPHTPQGIPLEILLFINETQWEKFEDWVSDLMEPLVALAPDFALRIYQQPSSSDFGNIGRALEADAATPGLQRPAPPTPGNVRNS